jgi:single-strand DNA-binding protein
MIVVEGSLRTGSYTDKNHSDVTHYTTDVMVDNVEFAGDKGMNATGQASANPSTKDAPVVNDLSDYEEILSDGDTPF